MAAASQVLSGNRRDVRADSRAASSQTSAASYAGLNATNFAPGYHNKISTEYRKELPAFTLTNHERTARIQAVMREFAGNENAIAKLASALQCSEGSAKNYLEGKSTPSGQYDDRALAVIPGYLSLKAEMSGLQMELDPRHQQKVAEFMRYCTTQADKIFWGEP